MIWFSYMKCKVSSNLLDGFPWAVQIPGNDTEVKCRLDKKTISVARGQFSLTQHQNQKVHLHAVMAQSTTGNILQSFDSTRSTEDIYASIENASSNYKKNTQDTVVENTRKRSIAEQSREDLLVFKRHTSQENWKQRSTMSTALLQMQRVNWKC